MSDQRDSSRHTQFTAADRKFLVAWTAGLVAIFCVMGWLTVRPQRQHRLASFERHQARMSANALDPGMTSADLTLPEEATPVLVDVGLYVDRISELSVKDVSWTAEFYIWFRWKGDTLRLKDAFQVVDGAIESQVLEVERLDGDRHYERYRVMATMTKSFDVSRFPRDEHLLTIAVECPDYQRHELLFVADQSNTSASSRVHIPAYEISETMLIEKAHSYKTTRGDPDLPDGTTSTWSQARMGISITRSGWGYYFKMFQALYVAVSLSMLSMFIKPTNLDPRFGLGIGGLFAAVANSYVTSSLIPDTGVMTLADMVNGLGTWMILLTVIQSTISLYLYEHLGAELLSRRFDRISFAVLSVGYLSLNFALPLAAN